MTIPRGVQEPVPSALEDDLFAAPGDTIFVEWRAPSPGGARGEWAEVIQRLEDGDGRKSLLCETLGFVAFSFTPQRVALGCDDLVLDYELAPETEERAKLRSLETSRLHAAVTKTGRLSHLKVLKGFRYLNARLGPSELRVKATLLDNAPAPMRRTKQRSLERLLERRASRLLYERLNRLKAVPEDVELEAAERNQDTPEKGSNGYAKAVPSCLDVRSLCNAYQGLCACETQVEHEGTDHVSDRHSPELCPDCIATGTWCQGHMHYPEASACLDAAARSVCPGLFWSRSESGVEAKVEYDGGLVLLQLRPWLFCISDSDAELFG